MKLLWSLLFVLVLFFFAEAPSQLAKRPKYDRELSTIVEVVVSVMSSS